MEGWGTVDDGSETWACMHALKQCCLHRKVGHRSCQVASSADGFENRGVGTNKFQRLELGELLT